MKHEKITNSIIRAFYNVYNMLGYGFLEKVYENAMRVELMEMGLFVEQQKRINVYYKSHLVGDYYADFEINNVVILELKAHENVIEEHENQLVNYLKATEIEVGLLLNFGKKPEVRRKLFDNSKKMVFR